MKFSASVSIFASCAAVLCLLSEKSDAAVTPSRMIELNFGASKDRIFPTVIGGKPVQPPFKYAKWMAVIQKGDYQFCAGTMFTDELMITAAHCSTIGFPLHTLTVSLHRHDLSRTGKSEGAINYSVEEINVHPRFSPYTLANDIAVWRLKPRSCHDPVQDVEDSPKEEENVVIQEDTLSNEASEDVGVVLDISEDDEDEDDTPTPLSRVRLDNGKNSFPGRKCTVLGWGATEEGGETSQILRELTISIMEHTQCRAVLGDRVADSMLCVGGERGRDSCQGDSGGPLVVMRGFGRPVLVGVVSWGKGCARQGMPGVYTRISSFRDWIFEFLTDKERLAVYQDDDEEDVLEAKLANEEEGESADVAKSGASVSDETFQPAQESKQHALVIQA